MDVAWCIQWRTRVVTSASRWILKGIPVFWIAQALSNSARRLTTEDEFRQLTPILFK